MSNLDWSRWPNFSREEFVCRCGCGRADMDEAFMDELQELRDRYGKALIISSGFRCPDYNAKVSPATGKTGPHTTGKAADIRVALLDAHEVMTFAAGWFAFNGIGVKQHGPLPGRFLHLDNVIEGPRPRIWSYS